MRNKKHPLSVIIRFSGLLFFLLLLYLAHLISGDVDARPFHIVLGFLDENLVLIVFMSVIFIIADVFDALVFPLNLPAPVFNAVGSVFIVMFLSRLFSLIDVFTGEQISPMIAGILWIAYPVVFVIVLITGYLSLFSQLFSKPATKSIKVKKAKSWQDISDEFRQLIYDFLTVLRDAVKGKP